MNVYHTEKQLTYHLSRNGVTKQLEPDAILNPKSPEGGSTLFKGMYALYGQAAQENFSGTARFEARLPIQNAHSAIRTLSQTALLRGTLVIPSDVLW